MNGTQAAELTAYLALGLVAGTFYFLVLRHSVDRFVRHGAALAALPFFLARVAIAVLAFWIAAQSGTWPLLATAAGFMIARTAIVLTARRGP